MTLSQQELAKVRKTAEESVTLSNDMKSTAVDEKLRTLNASIKKKGVCFRCANCEKRPNSLESLELIIVTITKSGWD